MNTDLYRLLGAALATKEQQVLASKGLANASVAKPITLLNQYPVVLTPSDFANPRSTANPNGDLRSLWRFRQLTDPLPQFTPLYLPSSSSTEENYVEIVKGATAQPDNAFASGLISAAQLSIDTQTFANMDGTQGAWRPVYAVPDNWFDCLTAAQVVSTLTLDLSQLVTTAEQGADSPLTWKITNPDNSFTTAALDAGSKLNSVQVNYVLVNLIRPWLNPSLFATAGWYLQGQAAGFCSSGKDDGNGILPLIPTAVAIGTSASISASWGSQDAKLIASAAAAGQQLDLGPLPMASQQGSDLLYVLGWLMTQVPFSPQTTG